MKVSARPSSPHFTDAPCRIFVDGNEVTDRCYEACDDTGYAWCYLKNEAGEFLVSGNTVLTELLTGKVEIRL